MIFDFSQLSKKSVFLDETLLRINLVPATFTVFSLIFVTGSILAELHTI